MKWTHFLGWAGLLMSLMCTQRLSADTRSSDVPFDYSIQNPLYVQHIQLKPMSARLPELGKSHWKLTNSYSNIYEIGNGSSLTHLLDMELLRTALSAEVGIGHDFSLGMELPFLHFEGGFFDEPVQKFHTTFGFPNGGRQFRPNGAFAYQASVNGSPIYSVNQEDFSIGDISFFWSHHIADESDSAPAVASRFVMKLPTGDSDQGVGSGSLDYGFQLALEKTYDRFYSYLNVGYFVVYGNGALHEYMEGQMFSGLVGTHFHLNRVLSAALQLSGGTPLLTGMGRSPWDGFPLDLVMGLTGSHPTWPRGRDFFWQLAFTEDLNANGPSIDFSMVGTVGITY